MRVFIPALPGDLKGATLRARRGHGGTAEVAHVFPDAGEEEIEYVALLAAADDSLRFLAEHPEEPSSRVVVAVDLDEVAPHEEAELPTQLAVPAEIDWALVAAIFIDEDDVAPEIDRARGGDDEAFERVAEADLLWFDPSEREALTRRP